jgi:hypothetical protein
MIGIDHVRKEKKMPFAFSVARLTHSTFLDGEEGVEKTPPKTGLLIRAYE